MGCCHSTPTTNSPYSASPRPVSQHPASSTAQLPHDSSRAAINRAQPSLSQLDTPRSTSSFPNPHATRASRPNVPIRPTSPLERSPAHLSNFPPPWTRKQLEAEREAFFDTRVTGSVEVWNALRLVCEMLRQDDVQGAQGVLDAVSASCPNGRVASGRGRDRIKGGIYDERGVLYDVPAWVVSDPRDVVKDGDSDGIGAVEKDKGREDEQEDGDGQQNDTDSAGIFAQQRRDEKGKGRAGDIGEEVRIRARLSDRGTDVIVTVGMKQKVAVLVRGIQQQAGQKRVRLAYLGKILDEGKTLETCGWAKGHVVNALVFEGDEGAIGEKRVT